MSSVLADDHVPAVTIQQPILSLQGLRDGDPAEWRRAFEQLQPILWFRFLGYTSGDEATAEDLIQTTWKRAWQYRNRLNESLGKPFAAWLSRVGKNVWIDHCNRLKKERLTESSYESAALADEKQRQQEKPADDDALDAEFSPETQVALAKLRPADRDAFLLHYIELLPYEKIAARTGRSEGAVKAAAWRAKLALADLLLDTYKDGHDD